MAIPQQKIALVTGASTGIGLETALEFVIKGYFTVLLGRSHERGVLVLEYVKTKSGKDSAALVLCDLADLNSIRKFCSEFREMYSHLDVLVCNAGVLSFRRQETKDGLELHFGVCHIGHFLLVNLLFNRLQNGSHVIVISSLAHKFGKLNFNDLSMNKGYSVKKAYSRAKLCNMLFVYELTKRLVVSGVTVSGVHPGAVASNIGAKRKEGMQGIGLIRRMAGRFLSFFVKTPEQAAKDIVYIAVNEACANINGRYFANRKPAKASANSRSDLLAKRLWEASLKITAADI